MKELIYVLPLLAAMLYVILKDLFIGEQNDVIDKIKTLFLLSIINYSAVLIFHYGIPEHQMYKEATKKIQESIITGPPKFTPY